MTEQHDDMDRRARVTMDLREYQEKRKGAGKTETDQRTLARALIWSEVKKIM